MKKVILSLVLFSSAVKAEKLISFDELLSNLDPYNKTVQSLVTSKAQIRINIEAAMQQSKKDFFVEGDLTQLSEKSSEKKSLVDNIKDYFSDSVKEGQKLIQPFCQLYVYKAVNAEMIPMDNDTLWKVVSAESKVVNPELNKDQPVDFIEGRMIEVSLKSDEVDAFATIKCVSPYAKDTLGGLVKDKLSDVRVIKSALGDNIQIYVPQSEVKGFAASEDETSQAQ